MKLYHTSDRTIREPDIRTGRRNADFGQGFYLASDDSFAGNWARERTAADIHVNIYELDLNGLKVRTMEKDNEWYEYIFSNRRGGRDRLADYDVIIGPIANDTLFETYGIITSGLIKADRALELLAIGPEFTQIAIKTEKGLAGLAWTGEYLLSSEAIAEAKEKYDQMSREYEEAFAQALDSIPTD